MRKNNLWNRIFFKEEVRKNMKDAELQLTLSKWEERKSQLYGCNGFGIDPEKSLYDMILGQYKNLLYFNLSKIWCEAKRLLITYEKTGYLK